MSLWIYETNELRFSSLMRHCLIFENLSPTNKTNNCVDLLTTSAFIGTHKRDCLSDRHVVLTAC